MKPSRACVFAGPSLPFVDRIEAPGISYLPPARRGDVARAAEEHDVVLLIDGFFHQELAPSPKETFAACRISSFYGAASMGALRAAECRSYGATPLGAIARWYASETIDGDDEVAVLMHPKTFVSLTVPVVNVRYVARLANRRGLLDPVTATGWVRAARSKIYYAERSWSAVLAFAPRPLRATLRAIAEREGDLKRWDAQFAVRRILADLKRRDATS